MDSTTTRSSLNPLEARTVQVGFLLAGIVIAVTGVSYIINSSFPIRLFVWVIGVAFVGVALLALEWARAVRGPLGEAPRGGLRQFLLLAMPLSLCTAKSAGWASRPAPRYSPSSAWQ